jgi:hypothetical protein
MQNKNARRRALCGTLSTFLFKDEVGGDRSQPQQRGIVVKHFDSHPVITQDTSKDSRQAILAKADDFLTKAQRRRSPDWAKEAKSRRGFSVGGTPMTNNPKNGS